MCIFKTIFKMDFEQKVAEFLNNRLFVNNVIDLINQLKVDSEDSKTCILSIETLFTTVLKRGDFFVDANLELTKPKVFEVEKKYAAYLNDIYDKTWDKLILMLNSKRLDIRDQAMISAMNLIAVETRHPMPSSDTFPASKVNKLLVTILSTEVERKDLVELFKPFLAYQDVLFNAWKVLKGIMEETNVDSDAFTFNVLILVECMPLPKNSVEEPPSLLCFDEAKKFVFNEAMVRKWMQKVWRLLVNRRLSSNNHRRLLIVLLEGFLSTLPKPTLLTDFLIASIGMGGGVSLLALQGMSTLVVKHNLECPDIFGKLYNLFEPEILHTKYKSRLFFLADLFLQSTYISEQLVAAFAKRISRLSLIAQAPDLVVILHFVGNLIIRHPALSVMLHHPVGGQVDEDPFDMEERDPLKSKALESSLWELALLKHHVQPTVANAAKVLESNLPSVEYDLREDLDASYTQAYYKILSPAPTPGCRSSGIEMTSNIKCNDPEIMKIRVIKCPPKSEPPIGLITRNQDVEIIGSKLVRTCRCAIRNGLDNDCPRASCRSNPGCHMKPWPRCWPQFKPPGKPEVKELQAQVQLCYTEPREPFKKNFKECRGSCCRQLNPSHQHQPVYRSFEARGGHRTSCQPQSAMMGDGGSGGTKHCSNQQYSPSCMSKPCNEQCHGPGCSGRTMLSWERPSPELS